MPKIDFDKIDDVQDFTPVPEGEYPCQVENVEESRTQYDDEMWRLEFAILDGEYAGRKIFDNLVFSDAAAKRVKLIVSRLGLNTTGELDLTPEMLVGRKVLVSVEIEEYIDDKNKKKKRNTVPFAGYERYEEGKAGQKAQEEEAF